MTISFGFSEGAAVGLVAFRVGVVVGKYVGQSLDSGINKEKDK